MKSSKNLLEQLKILPYFTKITVKQLGDQLGLTNSTINTYISRFLKYKEVIRLKNGLYVSSDFLNSNKSDISYTYYLANIIRTPSYISRWSALQYYNLATESIYLITSVTPKVGREYQTKAGTFSYQSIKKDLLFDYSLVRGKYDFFIASPSKALFDLLYFKTKQLRGVTEKEVLSLVEEMRVDLKEMSNTEQDKFRKLIRKYCHE